MFAKNIYFDSLICRSRVRQPLLLAPHLKIRLMADAPYNIYNNRELFGERSHCIQLTLVHDFR